MQTGLDQNGALESFARLHPRAGQVLQPALLTSRRACCRPARLGSAVLLGLGLLTLVVNAAGLPLVNRQLPSLTAQAAEVLQREVRISYGQAGCSD